MGEGALCKLRYAARRPPDALALADTGAAMRPRRIAGKLGNKGKLKYNSQEAISDAKELQYEVAIDGSPLADNGPNEDFRAYCTWLNGLCELYVEHLAQHLKEYPVLAARYRDIRPDLLKEVLRASMARPVKVRKGDTGEPLASHGEYIFYKQRIFVPSARAQRCAGRCRYPPTRLTRQCSYARARARAERSVDAIQFECEEDQQFFEKDHVTRVNVPLFNRYGALTRLSERALN